jgi:formate hydrogenlyase subunit 6/NADH:ubiquinone oxidoreductase subunit I
MTDAKTHWCLLTFRCVHCGRNEAFAEDSFKGEPGKDQITPQIYQAICRYCGWEGEVCGLSAVEMRSGVELRTGIRNKKRNRPTLDG